MAKQNKLTVHHLIWTRRDFNNFNLRHYHEAIIPLPKKLHEQLHAENEPFEPVSPEVLARMNELLRKEMIATRGDVLKTINRISGEILYDDGISGSDREALCKNIVIANRHKKWLDDHVPKWDK